MLTRFCAESGSPTQSCLFFFPSGCLRVVADACWRDNTGTTAVTEEFLCSDPSAGGGRRERTKAFDVARAERSPRAGPMGDIFFGGAHSLEARFSTPSPHFFLSVCLGRCEAGAGLALSLSLSPFLSGVGVESFSPKRHVFLILGPFVWKLFLIHGSAFTAGQTLSLQ